METDIEASDYIFKILTLGDAGVGKSALTIRFAENSFSENYTVTLGMNLVTKHVTLMASSGEETAVEYTVWDIGGQPNFKTILPMYYRGALGALIVYSIDRIKSFNNIENWLNDIKQYCQEVPLVIIGNKSDLESDRAITIEQGAELAAKIRENWDNDVHFIETSAKEDVNVQQAFMDLAQSILNMVEKEEEL